MYSHLSVGCGFESQGAHSVKQFSFPAPRQAHVGTTSDQFLEPGGEAPDRRRTVSTSSRLTTTHHLRGSKNWSSLRRSREDGQRAADRRSSRGAAGGP